MAKKIFHDVIPPDKRSIRNIPVPERKGRPMADIVEPAPARKRAPMSDVVPAAARPRRAAAEKVREPEPDFERVRDEGDRAEEDSRVVELPEWRDEFEAYEKPERGGSRKALWISVTLALLALAFALSSFFMSATVKVTPRQAAVPVSGTFTANREAGANQIPFEILKVSREDGRVVAATEERELHEKASGSIVIYNAYSPAPQTLIKGTRFETKDGLIYRIKDPVTVPGMKADKVPGSVEAVVTADAEGEKYNIPPADFRIPGFKGDPKYEGFYARSKTAMSGGFSGKTRIASGDTMAEVKDETQYALREQLAKDVQSQIPQNFTTFENGLIYTFEDAPQTNAEGGAVKVNQRGTLYAVIFNKSALGQALAQRFLSDYGSGSNIQVSNLEDLSFMIENATAFNPETDTAFNFTLNGNARLVWQYNENALKADLSGASKRQIDSILKKYPAIESAEVIVRPFWKQTLPKDTAEIKIETVIKSGQ